MSDKLTFEEAMRRLEEIVKALESGDAPLERSLALFEEGTALIKTCNTHLNDAEQKVLKLVKAEDGTPMTVPFTEEA